jgi:hypothetical protein
VYLGTRYETYNTIRYAWKKQRRSFLIRKYNNYRGAGAQSEVRKNRADPETDRRIYYRIDIEKLQEEKPNSQRSCCINVELQRS